MVDVFHEGREVLVTEGYLVEEGNVLLSWINGRLNEGEVHGLPTLLILSYVIETGECESVEYKDIIIT